MRDNYINIGQRKQMRRRTTHRVLIVVVSAIIIVVLSLLLGSYLKAQVAALPERGDIPEQLLSGQLPADTSDASEVSIMASVLSLTPLSAGTTIEQLVEELTLGSREAVSLCLRSDSGEIFYRSTVAQNLTGQAAAGVDLAELLPALQKAGIYTSAVFGVNNFSETDTAVGELTRAYEISLCAEIGAAGVEEILLTGLPITVDTLDAVTAFLDEIHAQLPESVQLAVAVPVDLTANAAGTVLAKQLSRSVDTLALDLRGLTPAEGETLAQTASAVFADASLYFSKYNMRVLIPATDDATFSELHQVLELNAVHNWQIVE